MSDIKKCRTLVKCPKALRKACDELGLELLENANARTYYAGRGTPGELVVKLKGPYDVAFNRQPDDTLEATCDWHGGHVERELGPNLNRLNDVYLAHRLTDKARAKGLLVQRSTNAAGKILLKVTAGALGGAL